MRTIPSIIVGAGGATAAYEYGGNIMDGVREAVRAITHHATRPSWERGVQGEKDNTSALTKEIENLKRMLRDSNSQKSVVVVNRGGGYSWSFLTYTAFAMGAGYLYLRFVKGWRLADFFYVSQASLKASTSALKQGIDGLKEYTAKTKEFLQGRLEKLETKQTEHFERTERIDERITVMHEDVDEMRGEIGEVGSDVREVKGTLGEIQDAQQYNSQGIFLLLRVVGELVYNNDFRIGSRQALDQFSKRPPPISSGSTVAGLESLHELSQPSEGSAGGSGWVQAGNPPSIAPAPEVTDVTSNPDSSGAAGRQLPRVLTRRGGGASSGRLLASTNGLGSMGSKAPR